MTSKIKPYRAADTYRERLAACVLAVEQYKLKSRQDDSRGYEGFSRLKKRIAAD